MNIFVNILYTYIYTIQPHRAIKVLMSSYSYMVLTSFSFLEFLFSCSF